GRRLRRTQHRPAREPLAGQPQDLDAGGTERGADDREPHECDHPVMATRAHHGKIVISGGAITLGAARVSSRMPVRPQGLKNGESQRMMLTWSIAQPTSRTPRTTRTARSVSPVLLW